VRTSVTSLYNHVDSLQQSCAGPAEVSLSHVSGVLAHGLGYCADPSDVKDYEHASRSKRGQFLLFCVIDLAFAKLFVCVAYYSQGKVNSDVIYKQFLPVSIFFAVSLVLSNKAYIYLAVSYIQVRFAYCLMVEDFSHGSVKSKCDNTHSCLCSTTHRSFPI